MKCYCTFVHISCVCVCVDLSWFILHSAIYGTLPYTLYQGCPALVLEVNTLNTVLSYSIYIHNTTFCYILHYTLSVVYCAIQYTIYSVLDSVIYYTIYSILKSIIYYPMQSAGQQSILCYALYTQQYNVLYTTHSVLYSVIYYIIFSVLYSVYSKQDARFFIFHMHSQTSTTRNTILTQAGSLSYRDYTDYTGCISYKQCFLQ